MTQHDAEKIARLVAAEIKSCAVCPLGVTQAQADAAKELAEAYSVGKKTAWKVIVTALIGLLLTLVGFGSAAKLAEIIKN